MNLKFKKLHPQSVLPSHSKPGDGGMDLTVTEIEQINPRQVRHKYGIAVEIPEGNVGLLVARSSVFKYKERLSNGFGTIDCSYRGELMAVFDLVDEPNSYKLYDRSAQLIIVPYVSCKTEWSQELSETERGQGGYGSTGA